MKIKFGADKVKISGPRVDGTYAITFETGEYEKYNVLEAMKIEPPVYITVDDQEETKVEATDKAGETLTIQEE